MRTFGGLVNAVPQPRPGTNEVCVFVEAEEGRLLAANGARVISGFETGADGESSRPKQKYILGDKVYIWLQDFSYRGRFPVEPQELTGSTILFSVEGRMEVARRLKLTPCEKGFMDIQECIGVSDEQALDLLEARGTPLDKQRESRDIPQTT